MSKLDFFKRAFRFIIRGVPIENIYVNVDQITHGNILLNHDDMGSVGKYDPIYISSIRKWYVAENK